MPTDLLQAMKLSPDATALVVIDMQERLAAAMEESHRERCILNNQRLIGGAQALGIPVLITEQYPKGLGPTVAPLREALEAFESPPEPIEKIEFDANRTPSFTDALASPLMNPVRSIVVTGMEAHICVYQTVRGLMMAGYQVHVPWDATCSRSEANLVVGKELWARTGAIVSSTETVLFDLLGKAGGEAFKAISRSVR